MKTFTRRILFASLALGFAGAASAAGQDPAAASRFQQERAACQKLQGDDLKTCQREAGAALIESRRGTLTDASSFEQNKFARCEHHKNVDDKDACERRMRGEGTVSGSVEGGGLLRELVVTVPAEQ